jgi:aminomethyltransferase
MPVGTPFHERTFALCESLNYREWSGYYAVSAYEAHHEHEYNAIRSAAALIDISPLFKYIVSGRDAARLVDRVITRDVSALGVSRVIYTPWCNEHGKVIDDGTVTRLEENRFRWTAAEPMLRWLQQNATGMDVEIQDVSERVAALALQGPLSALVLRACGADVAGLGYFHVTSTHLAGIAVDISRTGYTGDLGYEIWMPADRAIDIWDALMARGVPLGARPAGMLALDVARVEAGLLLLDVDFIGSRKAMTVDQQYTPYEMGLGRLVQLNKAPFVGRDALTAEAARGPRRMVVGLEIDWADVARLHERAGLVPVAPAAASRVAVPVMRGGRQIGRATTTAWSPTLKQLIALATVDAPHAAPGTRLEFEITVDARRERAGATVVRTPFLNPPRKTARFDGG